MKNILGHGKYRKVSEEDVSVAEKKLGFKIPKELITFYEDMNIFSSPFDQFENEEVDAIMGYFYPIKEQDLLGNPMSSCAEISRLIMDDPICDVGNIVIFNSGGSGDFFYISADEKSYGKVFYFSLEYFHCDPEDRRQPVILANNLSDFFDSLAADEESMDDYQDWLSRNEGRTDFSTLKPQ